MGLLRRETALSRRAVSVCAQGHAGGIQGWPRLRDRQGLADPARERHLCQVHGRRRRAVCLKLRPFDEERTAAGGIRLGTPAPQAQCKAGSTALPRRLAAPTQRHPCSGSFYASSSVPISIRNGCGSYTLVAMSRYYFDFRDNGRFVSDDAGDRIRLTRGSESRSL